MRRRRLTPQLIIDAAFRAWGATRFTQTGLHLVARELSVTKPTLYRHFRNKMELLDAMERDYREKEAQYVLRPLEMIADDDGKIEGRRLVEHYLTGMFELFASYPFHYIFYLRRILGKRHGDAEVASHLAVYLRRAALSGVSTEEEIQSTVRYLVATALFWTTYHYRKDLGVEPVGDDRFDPSVRTLDTHGKKKLIRTAADHFLNGFAPDLLASVDCSAVERIASIAPEELPDVDRVFSAVEEVVRRDGYGAATVERIADALGISKSSVYHYFANKDEMLSQTVIAEQERFASIASLRFRQLASNAERLYALFVLLADYAVLRPSTAIVEHWIRENHIEVQIPASHIVETRKIYTFITDMLVDGALAGSPEDAYGILEFVHFTVMHEISVRTRDGLDTRRYHDVIRALFRRFVGGVASSVEGEE